MPDHLIKGNFVAIPETTLDSDEWRDLTASTRSVYTAMLSRYKRKGGDGRVKWKQTELAELTGFCLKTTNTCLQELEEKEWISVWEPGGRWLDGTTYDMNTLYADGKE